MVVTSTCIVRGLAHERATEAALLPVVRDVQVVDVGAPAVVPAREHADEADDARAILGDDHELISARRAKTRVPHAAPILERWAVEKRVGHHAAVRAAPALGMQGGNRFGIGRRGRSHVEDTHA